MTNRARKFDIAYMRCAHTFSKLSRCNKKSVGAIVVRDGNILGFGYNGTAKGTCNSCEDPTTGKTYDNVIHAELNAILKAGDCRGAVMYTTLLPCVRCSAAIIQAGITEVVYGEEYKCKQGHTLLLEAGLNVRKLL